jgi:prephenate dehydrogenase
MDSGAEPPFASVAIIGLGLIGGSIALAVRERWPGVRVTGLDRPPVLAHALGSGAIDRAASGPGDLGDPALVLLAAPVRQNLELLRTLMPHLQPHTLVSDVGGTKRDIVRVAREIGAGRWFIGGHPIGGAERGGFGFARPDLFEGRAWIFTPDGDPAGAALEALFAFAQGLGARPLALDAAEHDRLMASLSHLPQLAASALMQVVGDSAGSEGLRVAGRGLVDTTRLASSAARVWRDICASNADEIGPALDRLIECLASLRADLERGEVIEDVFERAGRWRTELITPRRSG